MFNNLRNNDRAVSPVIGVILMVAITVILAAVIGTFVLTMGDNVDREISAGTSFDSDSESATVQWTSEGNADDLTVRYSITDEDGENRDGDDLSGLQIDWADENKDTNDISDSGPYSDKIGGVGQSSTISVSDDAEGDNIEKVDVRITVIGGNDDGVATTLRTERITLEIPKEGGD